jgi:hypothetical protein
VSSDALGRSPVLWGSVDDAAEFEMESGLAQEFNDWYNAKPEHPDLISELLAGDED